MMDFSSRLYPIAKRFYEAPTTCFNWRANNRVSRWVRQEAKSALNYDFHHFVRVDLGKVRTHLADIPKGAICCCCIRPRWALGFTAPGNVAGTTTIIGKWAMFSAGI